MSTTSSRKTSARKPTSTTARDADAGAAATPGSDQASTQQDAQVEAADSAAAVANGVGERDAVGADTTSADSTSTSAPAAPVTSADVGGSPDDSGNASTDDVADDPDDDRPTPCEEHFPLGWTEGATSLGCEHGQWDL